MSSSPASFGIGFVDELLGGGLRPGDNVMLLAERGTPCLALLDAFVAAPARRTVVLDLVGTWRGRQGDEVTVLEPGIDRVAGATGKAHPEDTTGDVDDDPLLRLFAQAEADVGGGASWLFDSLTEIQRTHGRDAALALFLTACPRLYRHGSYGLFPLEADAHDRAFVERVRATVEVVLELQRVPTGAELVVAKAEGRPRGTVGRRATFRVADGAFEVASITDGDLDIGTQLRTERLARGMSQAHLGELVGVSASAISQFERGTSAPSGRVLTRLWQALDVPFGPDPDGRPDIRVVRRSETRSTEVWEGVSARLLFDHDGIGSGWHVTIAPWAARRQSMFPLKAVEVLLVQRGVLDVELAGERRTLSEGDTLVTTREMITGWRNPAGYPSELLWLTLERHSGAEADR